MCPLSPIKLRAYQPSFWDQTRPARTSLVRDPRRTQITLEVRLAYPAEGGVHTSGKRFATSRFSVELHGTRWPRMGPRTAGRHTLRSTQSTENAAERKVNNERDIPCSIIAKTVYQNHRQAKETRPPGATGRNQKREQTSGDRQRIARAFSLLKCS